MKVETKDLSKVDFHVSEPIIETYALTLYEPKSQLENRSPWVGRLFAVQGVISVVIYRYMVLTKLGKVFSVRKIIPRIGKVLLEGVVIS